MAQSSGSSIQAQQGRAFLFKMDVSGQSPTVYTSVTGMRATQLKVNGNAVDITNKNSNAWQEMLSNAGVRKIDVSASGIYDGTPGAVFNAFEKAALSNTFIDAEIVFANGVTWTGTWVIMDFTTDGPYDNAQTFSCTITSHGPIIRSGN